MITSVRFQCLKSFLDAKIDFSSRITMLVGPNGTGKTTALQAIEYLCRIPSGSRPGNIQNLLTFGKEPPKFLLAGRIEVKGILGLASYSWERAAGVSIESIRPVLQPNPFTPELAAWCAGCSRLLLRYDRLVANSNFMPNPMLAGDGDNLASVLAALRLGDYPLYRKIVDLLSTIVPVRDVNIKPMQNRQYGLFFDFDLAKDVPAEEVSMGTVFVLGIITMILGPNNPRLLLIDDLDHGLHPKAQMELIGLIRKLIDEVPDLQVIATTHSPYVLDCLKPNEVKVTGKAANGYSVCVPLEEHPDFARWKDTMSPGEFWSYVGEGWIGKRTAGMEGVAVAP